MDKIKLEEMSVQSFVTSAKDKLKGGAGGGEGSASKRLDPSIPCGGPYCIDCIDETF